MIRKIICWWRGHAFNRFYGKSYDLLRCVHCHKIEIIKQTKDNMEEK